MCNQKYVKKELLTIGPSVSWKLTPRASKVSEGVNCNEKHGDRGDYFAYTPLMELIPGMKQ